MQNNEEELSNNDLEIEQLDVIPDVKQGVKLPTSESQWKSANDFFRAALPLLSINGDSLGNNIKRFHETIYTFFKENHGTVDRNNVEDDLKRKYKSHNKSELKKALKTLKTLSAPRTETKFLSRLLRKRLASDSFSVNENASVYATDHDARVKKNLWSYAKEFIERPNSALPSFDKTRCQEYFKSF